MYVCMYVCVVDRFDHQSGAIRCLHLRDLGLQLVHAAAAGIQHATIQGHRQGLNTYIVWQTKVL